MTYTKKTWVSKVTEITPEEFNRIEGNIQHSLDFSNITNKPANIKGIKGIVGDKGEQGVPGLQGDQGPKGPKGETYNGPKGRKGPTGPKGDTGKKGPNGKQGIQGPPGQPGQLTFPSLTIDGKEQNMLEFITTMNTNLNSEILKLDNSKVPLNTILQKVKDAIPSASIEKSSSDFSLSFVCPNEKTILLTSSDLTASKNYTLRITFNSYNYSKFGIELETGEIVYMTPVVLYGLDNNGQKHYCIDVKTSNIKNIFIQNDESEVSGEGVTRTTKLSITLTNIFELTR